MSHTKGLIDQQRWSPRDLIARVEPRFRRAVYRKVVEHVIVCTSVAVMLCIGAHLTLDRFGLLPYPVWPAVVVGSLMAVLLGGPMAALAMLYMASAYYHLQGAREEFERLSRIDPLTGLLNRRAFVQAFADTPRVSALALFDIDHFKQVNDRFGHGGGDAVLVRTARTLAEGFAAPDMVARIGGEEFAVMIASCDGDEATRLVERARRAIGAERVAIDHDVCAVTVSAGIVHVDGVEDIDPLLLAADRALYLAKGQGRDRLVDAGGLAMLRPPRGRMAATGIIHASDRRRA